MTTKLRAQMPDPSSYFSIALSKFQNKAQQLTAIRFRGMFAPLLCLIAFAWGMPASAGVLQADLAISKTGATAVLPGELLSYTIVVTNNGPSDVTGITVTDTFSTDLTACNWTCAADVGNSCTAAGAGDISDSVDILANSSVTFSVSCTVSDTPAGNTIVNTASLTAPPVVQDNNPANNTATFTTTLNAAPANIPTLSQWGLLVLIGLLASVLGLRQSSRYHRNRESMRNLP